MEGAQHLKSLEKNRPKLVLLNCRILSITSVILHTSQGTGNHSGPIWTNLVVLMPGERSLHTTMNLQILWLTISASSIRQAKLKFQYSLNRSTILPHN